MSAPMGPRIGRVLVCGGLLLMAAAGILSLPEMARRLYPEAYGRRQTEWAAKHLRRFETDLARTEADIRARREEIARRGTGADEQDFALRQLEGRRQRLWEKRRDVRDMLERIRRLQGKEGAVSPDGEP